MKNITFDATLDYHKFGVINKFEIEKLLEDFLKDCWTHSKHQTLVITGKGQVVRPLVLSILKKHKLVTKFEPFENTNFLGGSFVVYVR